ncbi:MAG: HAD family hydrolase [Candidatus Limnocylindrales bacterium]
MAGSALFPNLRAISFDFGNTLVPVGGPSLAAVVDQMISTIVTELGGLDPADFARTWAEERDRQFAEDVPRLREVDLDRRVVRVLARLRGMPAPPASLPWDDVAAGRRSSSTEIDVAVDAYSRAFVALVHVPTEVGPLLERLAARFDLAVLSNWPLASTIDTYVEAAGWRPFLRAVVVSQRVGTIKPDPRIFQVAETALGVAGQAILHVGDDWAADIVGAKRAGWRAAYLRDRQAGSPLPSSSPDSSVRSDLEIDSLAELEAALALARARLTARLAGGWSRATA